MQSGVEWPHRLGPHQIDNAGNAVAAIRALNDIRINETAIEQGLLNVKWPARLQRLGEGHLWKYVSNECELWLDGGHNAPAGKVLAQALKNLPPRPLVMIWGMLNTKDPGGFIANFKGFADHVFSIAIPDEANTISALDLAAIVQAQGLNSTPASSLEDALQLASKISPAPRLLICGSLYLAGHVLAAHDGTEMSAVSGVARR